MAIEDQRGRGLQHVEVLGDVGAMRQVDVEVRHALVAVGDIRKSAVHAGAAGAHLGAELQQRRALAERFGAQAARLDDLVGDRDGWGRP